MLVASLAAVGVSDKESYARRRQLVPTIASGGSFLDQVLLTAGAPNGGSESAGCITSILGIAGKSRADLMQTLKFLEPMCNLDHHNVTTLVAAVIVTAGGGGGGGSADVSRYDVALRWSVDTCVTLQDVLRGGAGGLGGDDLPLSRPASLAESLVMAVAISQGVGFLHGAGCAHGCITPFSVRVSSDGILMIADMGLAALAAPSRDDPVPLHHCRWL